MGVLDAFLTQGGHFYVGYYYSKSTPLNQGKGMYFKYEQITDKDKRYHQLVSNLITSDESIVIRTSWNMGFEVQGKVMMQDGEVYTITHIQEQVNTINPQAGAIVKTPSKLYYLEMT